MEFQRILIIQTAFIGDVILSTPVIDRLRERYPESRIDFMLRKGNESLLIDDPRLNELLIWDKGRGKYKALFGLLTEVRKRKYDLLVNLQRFASMGFLSCFSQAEMKVGFDKNPFSFCYDLQVRHGIEAGKHEVQRNLDVVSAFVEEGMIRPSIYLSERVKMSIKSYARGPYLTIAPTSVWFTKQFPQEHWIRLINELSFEGKIFLIGAPSDFEACQRILEQSSDHRVENLCGVLSLPESAALMKGAKMNYVNDSAPLHMASAVDAPVTAVFCSTIPEFGFGPLSSLSHIVEVKDDLDCRPCGLHGYTKCPRGHFKCAHQIDIKQLLEPINLQESPKSTD
jgi:ADP-heptose:LPS heptosyltransferase